MEEGIKFYESFGYSQLFKGSHCQCIFNDFVFLVDITLSEMSGSSLSFFVGRA